MFGFPYRGPGASPPKGNFKAGDDMPTEESKEEFIKTALAHVKSMLGEREKNVEARENRIYRMERLAIISLSAIQDSNPSLHRELKKEFDEVYKGGTNDD